MNAVYYIITEHILLHCRVQKVQWKNENDIKFSVVAKHIIETKKIETKIEGESNIETMLNFGS